MPTEIRKVYFDAQLNIETHFFTDLIQKFPNHFHEYYVIGYIEQGKRLLTYNNQKYTVTSDSIVLFNPYESHACEPINNCPLTYYSINIPVKIMLKAMNEINLKNTYPLYVKTILSDSKLAELFKQLFQLIQEKSSNYKKNELFYLFLQQLSQHMIFNRIDTANKNQYTKAICSFLERHYNQNITLDELSKLTNTSKYHLVRNFNKQTGISPISYLNTIRISQAKKLLAKGCSLTETALKTGFSDQSHFSNFFKKFIGLTPKQYAKSTYKIK